MKNIWNKHKWMLLLLINALPFGLDVLFFTMGVMDNLYLFLPILAGLTALNYRNCQKVVPFILYQAFMLICIICAGYASTYLYYHNVSNDFMTPVVGELMTILQAGFNVVATAITAIVKAVTNRKRTTFMERAQ